ncbi:uncharacterized protein (TIGR02679 family) [Lipingzhangella halophila]|uniref:Uncharacterized protein (TIGR02679 family) n=1 Tax=Lipingzhangella halophila TaxID=1783352 RepID=A0A7W7W5G1_9ACTN|nr:TIGR02679 family protein [Lipingzhangella halophila]MBB4934756.1 uncharacterized protein (TIGR02679 family) [Lipingzhangella halophila]
MSASRDADPNGDTGKGADRPRLERLLGTEDIRWLVDRARSRIERGQELTGVVTLSSATPEQRDAIQRLLGRRPRPGSSLTVSLDAVDAVLRRSGASPDGLAAAVEELTGGPVRPRAEVEADLTRAWDEAYEPLSTACARRPELAEWCARLRASGLVPRLLGTPAEAAPTLRTLATVVSALPADGVGLATFAARVCGDAHGLDDGRPLGTLALGAARALTGVPAGSGAEWRREAWTAAGLLTDDLSSTALAFGLPGDTATPTGRALAALREAGQPAVLTLRQLVQTPARPLPNGTVVRVCENPAVVSAAADYLGAGCLPLVCTQGQPGTAVLTLLRQLGAAGAELRYHGDFDWGGVRIANTLLRRVPWRPWRYSAADYRAAVRAAPGTPLMGTPLTAAWDATLTEAMNEVGTRVEEEAVLNDLLGDLSTP